MFKFLKNKLKEGIAKLSKDIDEQGEEEIVEEVTQPEVKKKGFLGKIFSKKEEVKEEPKFEQVVEKKEEIKPVRVEPKVEPVVEKKQEVKQVKEEPKATEKPAVVEKPKEKVVEKKEEVEQVIVKDEVRPVKEKQKVEKVIEKEELKVEPVVQRKEEIKQVIVKKEKPKPVKEEVIVEPVIEKEEEVKPAKEEHKRGFFGAIKEKIVTRKIDERKFEELFWDLEVALLENNVAVEVIEKIKEDLKVNLTNVPLKRGQIENIILKSLKDSVREILDITEIDLLSKIKEKKPYVLCFVGINGSGKTTSIAKVAYMLKQKGFSVVLAAADTFRAAAIDQLGIHAERLGVKLIKHDYGSDPAAVAFDAIQHAKAKSIDVVLIDTAGRMHSNSNLTDEMKKIVKVAKPDMKIFVGESITGNDCVEQAKKFNEAIGIDALILSKADIDEKGGAAVSVSYVTGKPIIYIGTGQEYKDLSKFDSSVVFNSLGL
ncbi:MAG: signal recognition particle-docking protein FtsY [Nanoarchaeota archaeon]|nr:signal recognition particle-docking protein FtsY [Nanoarchaeota archaeon]